MKKFVILDRQQEFRTEMRVFDIMMVNLTVLEINRFEEDFIEEALTCSRMTTEINLCFEEFKRSHTEYSNTSRNILGDKYRKLRQDYLKYRWSLRPAIQNWIDANNARIDAEEKEEE